MNIEIISENIKKETLSQKLIKRIKKAKENATFTLGNRGFKINDISSTMTGIKRIGLSQGLAIELYPKEERIDITSKRNKISFRFNADTVKIFADDFECRKKYTDEEIEKVLEKVLSNISETGGFKFGIAII